MAAFDIGPEGSVFTDKKPRILIIGGRCSGKMRTVMHAHLMSIGIPAIEADRVWLDEYELVCPEPTDSPVIPKKTGYHLPDGHPGYLPNRKKGRSRRY